MEHPLGDLLHVIEMYKRWYGETETDVMKHIRAELRYITTLPKAKREGFAKARNA